MSLVSYLLLDLGTLALFAITFWHAWKRGSSAVAELLTAALYGLLLEYGMILTHKTYSYSSGFWLALGPVPITIGLCWGMIIYGAMLYTDQLGLPRWAAPFADSLVAILLDLAFDAIAIRLQLWTWTIPLSAGYFGVPADNFFAWLFVTLSFSAFTRWVRQKQQRKRRGLQVAAPLAAFVGLVLSIELFGLVADIVYPAGMPTGGGLPIFGATFLVFMGVVGLALWRREVRIHRGVDLVPTLVRWSMHGYFLGWAVLLTFVPVLRLPGMDFPPFLLAAAMVLFAIEALLLVPLLQPQHPLRRQVSVHPLPLFRDVLPKARVQNEQSNA